MKVTNKLIIAFASMSSVAFGIGLAAAAGPSSLRNPLSVASIALVGTAIACALALLVGRSVDKQLGAQPAELARMASELAGGYLAPLDEDSMAKEGAAAELGLATAQFNTVFRSVKSTVVDVIETSHKICGIAMLGSGGDEERRVRSQEIIAQAQELAKQAQVLQEAIGFYSFSPREEPKDEKRLASLESLRASAEAKKQPRHRPSRGHRPKLRLLPRPERAAPGAMLFQPASGCAQLRLIAPDEETKE
jgi:hypothetical protein